MKRIFTFLMVLCLTSFGVVQAQTSFFSEDFEGGSMPTGWTTDGPGTWSVGSGDYSTSTGAGQGTYNAKITHGTTGAVTKLITPAIDLASAGSAELSFMHVQRSWSGDIDQLRVYYRTSSSGSWNLLEAYTSAVSSWTTHNITLSDFSRTYQIAFEYTDKYGYGVGIDAISIVGEVASCTLPTNVHIVGEIGPRNATIAWDAESGDMFQYAMLNGVVTDFSSVTWGSAEQISTQNWNTLNPDSDYTFAIRKYCSAADQSPVVSLPIHTDIACPAPTGLAIVPNSETAHGATVNWTGFSSSYILQYIDPATATISGYETGTVTALSEGFEGGSMPEGWTADSYWGVGAGTGYSSGDAGSGNYNAYCYRGSYDGEYDLVTPAMDLSTATSATLTFKLYNSAWGSDINELQVRYRTNGGSWTTLKTYSSEVSPWTDQTITLTGLGADYQISFYCVNNYSYGTGIDDIEVKAVMPVPVYVWNEVNNATSPYTFNNLDPATTYNVRVIGNCGSDGNSQPSNMVTFTTLESCPTPTALNVPETTITAHGATLIWTADNDSYNIRYMVDNGITEGFEGGVLPNGWTVTSTGSNNWAVATSVISGVAPHGGSYAIGTPSGTSSRSEEMYLISPSMDLSTATSATLHFYYYQKAWGSDIDPFGVYYRVNGGSWQELFYSTEATSDWTEKTIELQGLAANYQIGFYRKDNYAYGNAIDDIEISIVDPTATWLTATSNTTSYNFTGLTAETTYVAQVQGVCGGETTDWSETYSFTTLIACPAPTNLVAGTPEAHSVALSWTETGGATAWQICLNGDEENLVDVVEREVTITEGVVAYTLAGLSGETDYTVKVRANCGGEDGVSSWSNTVSFTTEIACPTPTLLTNETPGDRSVVLSWTENGEATAWQICINGDEENLVAANSNPFTLEGLTPATEYTVKVRAYCDAIEQSLWSNEITFETYSNCHKPTDLAVSNITSHGAFVTWNGEAENYNVKYRTATVNGTELEEVFFDSFEGDGLEGWTTYVNGYAADPSTSNTFNITDWHQQDMTGQSPDGGNTGTYAAMSRSYDGEDRTVDNWLVSPQMILGDVVQFYVAGDTGWPEYYAVYVSTGTNAVSDFEFVTAPALATEDGWSLRTVDISAYAGQTGYVAIRHMDTGKDYLFVDDFAVYNTVNAYLYGEDIVGEPTDNTCQLTGLESETLYQVLVQSNCGDDGLSTWAKAFFTTPEQCAAPQQLAHTDVTAFTATLNWLDDKESYNLKYRKAYFFESFEGETLPTGWTTIDANGDGLTWGIGHSTTHSGYNGAYDVSYVYNTTGTQPDDYLVSPLLDLQGTLRVWLSGYARSSSYYSEHFAIYLSTTGNTASDFTTELVGETVTTNEYVEYTADLSSYEGLQGYIAIRHFNCSDQYYLYVDDFGIYGSEDWVALDPNPTTETVNLTDLIPGIRYEWQVQGVNCDGNGGTTEWSVVDNFTTEIACPAPTDLAAGTPGTRSVELTWIENGGATAWQLCVNNDNENFVNVTESEVTITEGVVAYTLAGLADGTEFTVKVRANCGSEDGVSRWSNAVTFTTEPVTTLTQTVTLAVGLNWFSTYVDITLDDLKAALVAAAPGTQITINSQTQATTYNGSRWRGTLNALDVAQMYIIEVTVDCEITLEGAPIDPAEHPVTIKNGMNWIAFPFNAEMTPADAFAGFAVSGDEVISRTQSTAYNGIRWRGTLTSLTPGQGFIYKSNAAEDRVFTYPTAK